MTHSMADDGTGDFDQSGSCLRCLAMDSKGIQVSAAPDSDLIDIVYQEHFKSPEFVVVHLRDARNLLYAIHGLNGNKALSKAAILLAAASLESNLTYLSSVALGFIKARPNLFSKAHVNFARGVEEEIDDNGKLVTRKRKQSFDERLRIVPQLLARALGRQYELPTRGVIARKLQRTIERRDAIIHPKWDRYIKDIGWWEAAEAVDAVELYLNSVRVCLHPYLIGYVSNLFTIKGSTKDDVGVGHRTYGKRGPKGRISTMAEVGIVQVLIEEWTEAMFVCMLALDQGTDEESEGSMLTRSALVLLYAMLDAQLAVISQWKLREMPSSFREEEALFLNEAAIGVGHDGEVWTESDQHPFKKRIKAIPVVLARCCENGTFSVNLSDQWGRDLLDGYAMRSAVMHSTPEQPMPVVSKPELRRSARAIRSYLEALALGLPNTFKYIRIFLEDFDRFVSE